MSMSHFVNGTRHMVFENNPPRSHEGTVQTIPRPCAPSIEPRYCMQVASSVFPPFFRVKYYHEDNETLRL